jgi:diguanylate cyclase (GGDEF)-like protein
MEQPRETAGTTMRLVVDYVRRARGEDGVRQMLALAGEERPLSVLEDERVWSSYDAKVALMDAAAVVTGQPDVARRVGESALESQVGSSLKLLIGLVGSPAQLIRGIARVNNKFSTAADMTAVSSDATSALIRYRVRDGYEPSRHDCGYTMGLLSQVPKIFGLPAASVVHKVCQVEGADACLYALRWQTMTGRFRRLRGERSKPVTGLSAATMGQRLRDLQETVAELVAGRSVDEVLNVVAEHARTAVGAQRFLLATRLDDDRPARIHADGFPDADAAPLAELLLADEQPDTDEHVIVAPVRSMSRDYGRLAAFARSAFLDHEQDLLRSYASLAATALDAITALDEARDRQHVAEVLLRFARALLETRDRVDVADTTAQAALSLVNAHAATVLLYDEGRDALATVGSAGWSEQLQPLVDNFVIEPRDTVELADLLANPDQPRVYDHDSEDPFIRRVLEGFGTSQVVAMPLRSAARLWGVVITAWRDEAERPTVQRLFARLSGLADQAVAALERAELTEQVHRQATVDTLTGVANRLAFTDRLDQCLADRTVVSVPAGVIFLDLDKFKSVNDTLGHNAGDELLTAVARRLRELVRTDDLVARLGGDEFTILLPSVQGPDELADCAARILTAFEEPVPLDGTLVHPRPSVGAVLVEPSHASVSDVLRQADAAMYAAKKAGGNRFVVYDSALFASVADGVELEIQGFAG